MSSDYLARRYEALHDAVAPAARRGLRVSAQADAAEVYLYDEIGFFGVLARDFQRELAAIDAPHIVLHINSPGGDVTEALGIYRALLDHPAQVTTRVDGLAASAASFVAMAGDRVAVAKRSMMMVHDGMALTLGNAADMRHTADRLDKLSDMIAGIYADRAGKDAAHWRELMVAETWFSDEEAVAAGLADAVDGEPAVRNTFDLSIFRHAPAQPDGAAAQDREQEAEPSSEAARRAARIATATAQLEVAAWQR